MKRVPRLLAAGVFALAAACGGSGAPSSSSGGSSSPPPTASTGAPSPAPSITGVTGSTAPAVPITVPTSVTTAAPTGTTIVPAPAPVAVTSLDDVRRAVVRVVGVGTFADGGDGSNVPGRASGFLIDRSGRVVTSRHAVAGADRVEVYVDGEQRSRPARVLGVAECADLAVIQVDGDAFDHLTWSAQPVTVGTEVFAAGIHLGTSGYTVLDGVVSSVDAEGGSPWASPDRVVEHSAGPVPGGAGGPVVRSDGTVVAVGIAGSDPADAGRSLAVAAELARPLVEVLAAGGDVDTIGLNGRAVVDESGAGIRVASVRPGSPAADAGLLAGDLLVSMGSVALVSDGTMADYCDVVRGDAVADRVAIEVYRADIDALLVGELGGRPLEVVTSFATELDEIVADAPADDDVTIDDVTITDGSGSLQVDVPATWVDVDRRGWLSDLAGGPEQIIGPALSAAPDLAGFRASWGVAGAFVGASSRPGLHPDGVLDALDFTGDCRYEGRADFGDWTYTGRYDLYTACGPDGSVFVHLAIEPADGSWLAMVQVVARSEADLAAADRIVETLVVGDLAG